MLIELQGLPAEGVHALQTAAAPPPGVQFVPMTVDAMLDGETEGFVLSASLALTPEVSTDEAAGWLWQLIADAEEGMPPIRCTVADETRDLRQPRDLAALIDAGREAE